MYNIVTYDCPHHIKNQDNKTYSIESDSNITFNLVNMKKNPITIKDCFEYVQKEKVNNEFFCTHCQKIVKGKSTEKIFCPPNILTIILNRGHGKTFRGKVQIENRLDISKFIDREGKQLNKYNDKIYYRLIGSCNHSGDSSPSGHYTATCYNEEKESYYLYNDISVKKLGCFQYCGEPYILFYKCMKYSDSLPSSEIMDSIQIRNDSYLFMDEYKQKLKNVFLYLKYKDNKQFTIELYRNDLFKWKITIKDNDISLIMDFSNPPNYDLLSITYFENDNKRNIKDYFNYDNIKISLNEKEIEIFEKIDKFLENSYDKVPIKSSKGKSFCPSCIII